MTSPFDIAAIAAQIDRAAASLKPDERGSITVQLNQGGFGAGLVVRGPGRTSALAMVTKPLAGRWGWSVTGRIAFLLDAPPPPVPVLLAPGLRGPYRLFREAENGRLSSMVKAVDLWTGGQVRLRG